MQAMNPAIKVVGQPSTADFIVDDIIDSGATRDRMAADYGGIKFVAIVDKGDARDRELGWVVFPWEGRDETADIEDTVIRQLEFIGEDPTRDGLKDTPRRYIKALRELTAGMNADPAIPLGKVFDEHHDEIVVVRGIDFVSLCEHHLLPFSGQVDFAYLPVGKVVGLSKIPRFIQALASRPQVQERLTTQIADTFCDLVKPGGVVVVVRAQHSCMRLRGVKSTGEMVTSVVRGAFKDEPEARAEALTLMRG